MIWLILAGYLVGFAITWRGIFAAIWKVLGSPGDEVQMGAAAFLAALLCIFWPFIAFYWLAVRPALNAYVEREDAK